uniref:Uncharacterized protein n=1 Tax=Tetranychus urticae TaxID=32264 RepID=T1K592_TETUR
MANCVSLNTTLTDESTKSQVSTKELSVDASLTKQSDKLVESSSTAETNLASIAADSEDSSNADELAINERKKGKKGGKRGKGCGR